MIVSGFGQTRSVSGKGTFVIPGLQRVDTLALGAVQVQLSTENEIPTQDAILIHACAVANFQIGQTPELIEIASKNYLNMDKAEMTRQVTEVMLGKMREVIGQMDLKELMRDRESFNHKVFEGSRDDLANLGLELRTFNVQDFSDSQGIIRSMGADQAAEIKKEAELAQIRAEQEVAERQPPEVEEIRVEVAGKRQIGRAEHGHVGNRQHPADEGHKDQDALPGAPVRDRADFRRGEETGEGVPRRNQGSRHGITFRAVALELDFNGSLHPDAEHHLGLAGVRFRAVEARQGNFHRDALHDLGEVARDVFGGNQGKNLCLFPDHSRTRRNAGGHEWERDASAVRWNRQSCGWLYDC